MVQREEAGTPWKPVGEDNTDVLHECGIFFMRARVDHFSQWCLVKKIQLENAIYEHLVTWPSWAPPRKRQVGFVNVTDRPLILLVLPTSWSNRAIVSVATGVAFEGLEANVAISRAVQQSILTEATQPQVLQVPCTQRQGDPRVGQDFPHSVCSLPKVTGTDARVALITANADTVDVWDYRIVQQRTWVWVLPGQFSAGMLPLLGTHRRNDLTRGAMCLMNIALMATAKGLQPTAGAPGSTISSTGGTHYPQSETKTAPVSSITSIGGAGGESKTASVATVPSMGGAGGTNSEVKPPSLSTMSSSMGDAGGTNNEVKPASVSTVRSMGSAGCRDGEANTTSISTISSSMGDYVDTDSDLKPAAEG